MDYVEASKQGLMRLQTESKAELIRKLVPDYDDRARRLLNHETCLRIRSVIAGGSGDSYNAPLATELFYRTIAQMPLQAAVGMHLARYILPWIRSDELTRLLMIGISVSGRVSRTIEAVQLAHNLGALTMGITGNANSPLARVSDLIFHAEVPDPVEAPHVRTYIGSLVALYSIALRLSEVRETLSPSDAQRWREEILRCADVAEATYSAISDLAHQLAIRLKNNKFFLFVGSGPGYGMALYSAAKIAESVGLDSTAQDIEEWLHIQRYSHGNTATFVIAPPGLAYSRAVGLVQAMKRIGRFVVAVVEQGDTEITPYADVILPVKGHVPEILAPMVYTSALEVFASDLAQELREPYMRAFSGLWETHPTDDPVIRADHIEDTVDKLNVHDAFGLSQ